MTRQLINNIETTLNRHFVCQSDFVRLSTTIQGRTGERLSPSTLRRLWGYSNEEVSPRRFTLDVLSRFLLYRDYDDFCLKYAKGDVESGICLGSKIDTTMLCVGQMLRMSWLPDRCCMLRHLGNGKFSIVEAKNTKLSAGDTFECHLFINHEPAYLDNLMHEGQGPLRYVAGKNGGILVERAEQMQVCVGANV